MTEKTAKNLTNPKPKTAKPRGKSTGRKRASSAPKIHRAAPGRGAQRLRSSINSLVTQESDRIARALIDKTIAGNMTGARLLVELAGKPPAKEEKPYHGPTIFDLLASELDSDEENDRDPSKLPLSEPA